MMRSEDSFPRTDPWLGLKEMLGGWSQRRRPGNALVSLARHAVIEAMADGVVVIDPQGLIRELNPAAQAMLRQTEPAIGKPATEVFGQSGLLEHWKPGSGQFSEFMGGPGQSQHWYELRALPLTDADKSAVGQLLLLRDITERKTLERETGEHYHALGARHRRQAALARIGLTVNPTRRVGELLAQLVQATADLLPASLGASIMLLGEETDPSVTRWTVSQPASSVQHQAAHKDAAARWVIENREPLIVPDVNLSPLDSAALAKAGIHACSLAPLMEGEQVLGVLATLENVRRTYTREDIDFLIEIANRASVAIAQAQLLSQIGQLETRDELTGIANQRSLFHVGDQEMIRARRLGRALSVIMVDPDHFKRVNEVYGDRAGDQVLCELAQTMRANIREIDFLGRYGGEEFVILTPETELSSACEIAERIRKTISDHSITTLKDTLHITVSLGVAEITAETKQITDLINSAESAMLKAKQAGRNRIFYADHSLARHFYLDFLPM